MRLLDALVAGETDPEKLVDLTRGRLRASRATLIEALRGRVTQHHRFMLKLHLEHFDALDRSTEAVARAGAAQVPARRWRWALDGAEGRVLRPALALWTDGRQDGHQLGIGEIAITVKGPEVLRGGI